MATAKRTFLPRLVLFAAAMTLAVYGTLYAIHRPFTWPYGVALAYFTLITLSLHLWQERGLQQTPMGFMQRFMGGLVVKMLGSVAVLVLLLLIVPADHALPLGVVFAVLYLAFLAFSTLRLLSISRAMPKPGPHGTAPS